MTHIRALLLLACLAGIGCGGSPTQWNFEPFSVTVVDSTFAVPAGDVQAFFANITVDKYIRHIVLEGQFEVTDGGNRDIQVFVLRDFEFAVFLAGEAFMAIYGTNQVPSGTFSIPIESSDRYYVVFNNKNSATAGKIVKAKVVVNWEEQVARVPE